MKPKNPSTLLRNDFSLGLQLRPRATFRDVFGASACRLPLSHCRRSAAKTGCRADRPHQYPDAVGPMPMPHRPAPGHAPATPIDYRRRRLQIGQHGQNPVQHARGDGARGPVHAPVDLCMERAGQRPNCSTDLPPSTQRPRSVARTTQRSSACKQRHSVIDLRVQKDRRSG